MNRQKFREIAILLILGLAYCYVVTSIPVSDHLTPDSKLYYGLSQNIISGTGYYDTVRNGEILPPIGHPLILLFDRIIGDITFWEVAIGILAVCLSVLVYTKSKIMALISLGFLFATLKSVGFYKYGIEASGFMTASLIILGLSYMYRSNFCIFSIVLSVFFIFLNILVRPVLLYPLFTFVIFFALYYIFLFLKNKKFVSSYRIINKWFVIVILVILLFLMVSLYSEFSYGDKRLVRGTYAAMNLYLFNNQYFPVNTNYNLKKFQKYIPEEERNIVTSNSLGWEKREKLLFKKALNYIVSNPKRAISGWLWRLERYLGYDAGISSVYLIGVCVTVLFTILLLVLMFFFHGFYFWISKLGWLISFLFFIQVALLIIFSWTGPRYLIYLIPFLATAPFLILFELVKSLRSHVEN